MSPADRVDPVAGRTGARFGSSRRRRAAEARAAGPVESLAADAEEVRAADTAAGIRRRDGQTPRRRWCSGRRDGGQIPRRSLRSMRRSHVRLMPTRWRWPIPQRSGRPMSTRRGTSRRSGTRSPTPPRTTAASAASWSGPTCAPVAAPGPRSTSRSKRWSRPWPARRADRRRPPGDRALCASPRSVAEIAALLEIPLGVARVLVGDLAQDGAVVVHGTSGPDGPDATFMQRVLDGLRRL